MKKEKTAIITIIILLMGVAWFSVVSNVAKQNAEYHRLIASGTDNKEKMLYQKAIMDFEKALTIKESKEIRTVLLDTYALSVDDETTSGRDYTKALSKAVTIYPKEVSYWERLLEFLWETESYAEANDYRRKALRQGVKSEKLQELGNKIRYHYTIGFLSVVDFSRTPDGYYTVTDGNMWGTVSPNGKELKKLSYEYISPLNSEHAAIYRNNKGNRMIDSDDVVQSIYNLENVDTKAPSNMCFAKKKDDSWLYVDMDGKPVLDAFEDVSNVQKERVFVKKSGKWEMIRTSGESVEGQVYDDIKLFSNGDFSYKKCFVASKGGQYALYKLNGEKVNEFTAKDMDSYYGDLIAYMAENGKWGYVNTKGETVIEPSYDQAKSFSDGLGAVMKDGKWGYIEKKGDLVIDYQFIEADYFTDEGICMVKEIGDTWSMIKLKFN